MTTEKVSRLIGSLYFSQERVYAQYKFSQMRNIYTNSKIPYLRNPNTPVDLLLVCIRLR